jgi:hypothetical protein
VNEYIEEVNDATLSLNPTIVPSVNKVINQETSTNCCEFAMNPKGQRGKST